MQTNFLLLENIFNNLCFVCLASATFSYWIQNSLNFRTIRLGSLSILLSNLLLFSSLILRWYNAKHFPLSNQL